MFLAFPDFNIYSTPLLILVIQGLIFAFLLFRRYLKERYIADLFIVLLLVITAYHRTTYTVGFMGWYDTFRNTKINYYLVNFGITIGPLIYFYTRSLVQPNFKFKRVHLWHFFPTLLLVIFDAVILIHDMQQPGFDDVQNGEWYLKYNMQLFPMLFEAIQYTSYLLYFAFTIQLFYNYKKKIEQFFSNTYKVELNWIRNFLAVYIFLIAYGYGQQIVEIFTDLDYKDRWWVNLFSAIAVVYLGIKAYFTDLSKLYGLTFNFSPDTVVENTPEQDFTREKKKIANFFNEEKPYLNPDITLPELAKALKMGTNELSQVINAGFKMNFNDFINKYRIAEVKESMLDPKNGHLSLLAIAYDSGFNSKATFNRVFKKFTNTSPSQYLTDQKLKTS
ncbi:helix-turn-helix domain-containing protein [Sungkyunkwania multivorans]|uniref:Helix-turn-helix domain-containing protein n=1 Tax=Sungkyunkwania multivorans TaxID=1173618 RepID=A0ABW3CXF9_9FLAO